MYPMVGSKPKPIEYKLAKIPQICHKILHAFPPAFLSKIMPLATPVV